MGRLLRYLFYLAILVGVGVVGYAIFSELPPPQREIVVPVSPSSAGG